MTPKVRPRAPQAFWPDDPSLATVEPDPHPTDVLAADTARPQAGKVEIPTAADFSGGMRWGAILISAMVGLAALAAGAWYARFVSVALAREDWVGWTAFGLLTLAFAAAAVMLLREVVGLMRLRRLGRLRKDVEAAYKEQDLKRERIVVHQLTLMLRTRPELAWSVARFREHERDVHDSQELFRLAERELIAPLDRDARRVILASAKRVSVVTALSPVAFISVTYVLIENLRMLRSIATLYGGRPGIIGALKLARMVITHLVVTGGVALTDDLLGQFLGQDVLRRLSRRLGEGAFNGTMTARIGTAAVEVTRPLPFMEAPGVRLRDLIAELLRRAPANGEGARK
jgi:putative membrane protein